LASGAVGPVTEAQRHDLTRIHDASTYVLQLVTDLLTFSRVEADRMDVRVQPLRLADVVARAESVMEHLAAAADVTVEREAFDADCGVTADPARLQQVLLNLLTNAVKFTAPGGRITLCTERADGLVRLHVRDTGRGIPAEAIEHIFDPFVQLEQPGEGAPRDGVGLGLAISRSLARTMGGDLTAASTVGEGSTFTVALPEADALPDPG
jgi:signal transduction histidine kinase